VDWWAGISGPGQYNCRWAAASFVFDWDVLNGEKKKKKNGNCIVSGEAENERNILLVRKCLFQVGTGTGTEPRKRK
jgi:hypothetical protein